MSLTPHPPRPSHKGSVEPLDVFEENSTVALRHALPLEKAQYRWSPKFSYSSRHKKSTFRSPPRIRLLSKQQIYINPVGTDVPGGPMSHRSQIAYLSIAKIKIIYGNNIFIFCLRTVETPVPTIERGYSIEILAFTVIFLNVPKYRSPPRVCLLTKHKNYIKLVGATCGRPQYRSSPHVRLLPESAIYRSLLL